MTTQEHEQTRAAWDKIAAGYDEFVTATHMELGNEGLRRADLRPGMRFLDVAAGSGALSIPAARLGAQVLATDQSPVMLERLSARARDEGLPGPGQELQYLHVVRAEFQRAVAATRRYEHLKRARAAAALARDGILPADIPRRIFEEFYASTTDPRCRAKSKKKMEGLRVMVDHRHLRHRNRVDKLVRWRTPAQ